MIRRAKVAASLVLVAVGASTVGISRAIASDHLDTPTVIADPAADIGDLYAWTSSDGHRLNLVMDIVAHQFSDRLQYVFHVESGKQFGKTTASTVVTCRFDAGATAECWAGNGDYLRGNASATSGLEGRRRRFRVFAGLRDDPFFNNVKGTRAMYNAAGAAIQAGARRDQAGCPRFDRSTSRLLLDTWRHTDNGPAADFLAKWKASSLVVSIDLGMVNAGGNLLAIWGTVHRVPTPDAPDASGGANVPAPPALGEQIERTARPLIKNALVGGPLAADSESDRRREAYNRVGRTGWGTFASAIQETLGLYDGLDGRCGDQWLADSSVTTPARYERLATILADDRIWVNSESTVCAQFFAVELAALKTPAARSRDCGGRTPNYNASNIFRSLLTNGTTSGVDDGLSHDDKLHSTSRFPFLAAPEPDDSTTSRGRGDAYASEESIHSRVATTNGAIAIENLDHQIAEAEGAGLVDLLLLRSRFLSDFDALSRASAIGEARPRSGKDFVVRAKTRSAVHRFTDALADVDTAERLGVNGDEVEALRASILVATGHGRQVIPMLEQQMARHAGFSTRGALATAYASVGRLEDADRLYARALNDLDTSLPFPYAWTYFARGQMWAEQGKDSVRAAALYREALAYLPEFVVANVHLAELDAARRDTTAAIRRLEHVVESSDDPEPLGFLGLLHERTAQPDRGSREIAQARSAYESLLARHQLAFADHASEFFLTADHDAERARALAHVNLRNRRTQRAYALAIKAAGASGHTAEAWMLSARAVGQRYLGR